MLLDNNHTLVEQHILTPVPMASPNPPAPQTQTSPPDPVNALEQDFENAINQWNEIQAEEAQVWGQLQALLAAVKGGDGKPPMNVQEAFMLLTVGGGLNMVSDVQAAKGALQAADSNIMSATQNIESDVQTILNQGAQAPGTAGATIGALVSFLMGTSYGSQTTSSGLPALLKLIDNTGGGNTPAFGAGTITSLVSELQSFTTSIAGAPVSQGNYNWNNVNTNWQNWNNAQNSTNQGYINNVFSELGTVKSEAGSISTTLQQEMQQSSANITQIQNALQMMLKDFSSQNSATVQNQKAS